MGDTHVLYGPHEDGEYNPFEALFDLEKYLARKRVKGKLTNMYVKGHVRNMLKRRANGKCEVCPNSFEATGVNQFTVQHDVTTIVIKNGKKYGVLRAWCKSCNSTEAGLRCQGL
jgi:hypothetical protein